MGMGKNLLIWIAIFVLLSMGSAFMSGDMSKSSAEKLAFSEFMDKVENKQVSEVTISGASISGVATNGSRFYTYAPYDPTMVENLRKNDVKVNAMPEDTTGDNLWGMFISWFPMLLLIGVWVFFMRQANAGNNKAMSFERI